MIDPQIPLQTQGVSIPPFVQQLAQMKTQGLNNQIQQGTIKAQGQEAQGRYQALQQGQIDLQQHQQTQQDIADTRAATVAAVDPNTGQVDRLKYLSTLGKLNPAVAAQAAQGLKTQDVAMQEAQAKSQEAQLTAAKQHLAFKDQILQGANAGTWANTRALALQSGFNPQEIPEQYPGDAWVAQAHQQTLSQQQVIENHEKQSVADETVKRDAETARHNKADETNTSTFQQGELRNKGAELAIQRQRLAIEQGDPVAAATLLVNGDATLSELKARGSTPAMIVNTLAAAKKIDPNFNAQRADAEFSVAKSPANVGFFGSAKSLTDKGGTLDQLAQAAKDIPGGQIPVFNTIADAEKAAIGSGPIAKYASLLVGVSDDYSKVMGGGTGSDSSRAQALKLVPADASPEARAAAIEGIRGAVGSQINSRIGNNRTLSRMYGTPGAQAPARPAGVPADAKWDPNGNGGQGSWKR